MNIGPQIKELRMQKNYTQASLAAQMSGITTAAVGLAERGQIGHGNASVSEKKAQQILTELRQLPALPKQTKTGPKQKRGQCHYEPITQYPNARKCRGEGCGILIFQEVAEIPTHFITWLHIDCGGYCPPCAKQNGLAYLVRAKAQEIRNGAKHRKEQTMKVEKLIDDILKVDTGDVTPPPAARTASKWSPLLALIAEQPAGKWFMIRMTSKKTANNARAAINKAYRETTERVEVRGNVNTDGTYDLYLRKLAKKVDKK